jgi:chromosomal replication initiator protein
MDERLRSRFESGLIADIAPPNLETRLAILQKKAETERMRIPDDVLLYMARLVQSNIRTLEGALVKLIAYASLANSPVTTQLAADILERYYISAGADRGEQGSAAATAAVDTGATNEAAQRDRPRVRSAPVSPKAVSAEDSSLFAEPTLPVSPVPASDVVTVDAVRRVVARRFNLPVDALAGQKRDRDANQARHIAMHLVRELTEVSLPGIGQMFGGRSHSTVLHACERIREQIPFDDDLKRLIDDLVSELRNETAG